MNGRWYPWGWRHAPPAAWIAAWRHMVGLFRVQEAGNVTWLWTVSRTGSGDTSPVRDWWPVVAYVNWVGIDGQGDDDLPRPGRPARQPPRHLGAVQLARRSRGRRDYRVQVFHGTRRVLDRLTTRTSVTAAGLRPDTSYRWRAGVSGFRWSAFQLFRTPVDRPPG